MRNSGASLRRSKMFAMVCKSFIVIGWIFVRESYFLEIKMMAGGVRVCADSTDGLILFYQHPH